MLDLPGLSEGTMTCSCALRIRVVSEHLTGSLSPESHASSVCYVSTSPFKVAQQARWIGSTAARTGRMGTANILEKPRRHGSYTKGLQTGPIMASSRMSILNRAMLSWKGPWFYEPRHAYLAPRRLGHRRGRLPGGGRDMRANGLKGSGWRLRWLKFCRLRGF